MFGVRRRYREILMFIQVFFLYSWLSNLSSTDSLYSVYLLCGIMGTFCLLENCKNIQTSSRKDIIYVLVISALFSLATVLANYTLFQPISLLSLFNLFSSFIGGVVLSFHIIMFALHHLPIPCLKTVNSNKGCILVFLLSFLTILIVDSLYLFFVAYPGVLTRDSVSTITQILSGEYNNTMPFWHTMTVKLFYEIGYFIFGNANSAVAFVHCIQICFLSLCFSYALVTLYQIGIPKFYILLVFLLYTLMPYNIVYSVTLWKDVLFGGALLLLITSFYRILRSVGNAQFVNYIFFTLGGVGFSLWRTNGWYAFLITTCIMFLCLRKRYKKVLYIMGTIACCCWILINPVISALNVSNTDMVETLAIPFQQVARVVANDRELTEKETELLSQAFDLEKVKEKYNPNSVDPIKFETFRRENLEYISDNLIEYIQLYLKLGLRYPDEYLKAWIEETKGYWNGGYEYWIYDIGVYENEFGIEHSVQTNLVSKIFYTLFRLLEQTVVFQPLSSIGLCIWVIIGCFFINVVKKREEFLLAIPAFVLTLGLWLGTPVFAEFRYAYPMFVTCPMILATTLFSRDSESVG